MTCCKCDVMFLSIVSFCRFLCRCRKYLYEGRFFPRSSSAIRSPVFFCLSCDISHDPRPSLDNRPADPRTILPHTQTLHLKTRNRPQRPATSTPAGAPIQVARGSTDKVFQIANPRYLPFLVESSTSPKGLGSPVRLAHRVNLSHRLLHRFPHIFYTRVLPLASPTTGRLRSCRSINGLGRERTDVPGKVLLVSEFLCPDSDQAMGVYGMDICALCSEGLVPESWSVGGRVARVESVSG